MASVVGVNVCTCPVSIDAIICGKCGGLLRPGGVMAKIDMGTQQWFYELDAESRLNQTLAMYMAIDKQVRQGAPVTAAVSLATKQISLEFAGMEDRVQRAILDKLDTVNGLNQDTVKQIGETLNLGLQNMANQMLTLVEKGKSAAEIEASVREAAEALRSHVLALKLPGVKGDEAERNVLQELKDAYLGQTCVKVQPLGGADATDALITFHHEGVEIGRSLVEVKSRKNWSNDYLDQARADMKRYNAAFAVLAVEKLSRAAKATGYHVDAGEGMVITTTLDLVAPTITMFYEIHAASYNLQKKALNFEALSADKDLAFYFNDNMKALDDCKKISDIAEDSCRRIKHHASSIGSRLQGNNGKIAQILSKVSDPS